VFWEDHFYPEIVNPETGAVLADGETGELVITSLTKEALPVIRYRTRDLTSLLPPSARAMRRIAKISGRSDDMLIIRGVNVFPTQIEELLLQQAEFAPHYQLEVTREGALDSLTVIAEMSAALSQASEAAQTRAVQALQQGIKAYVGVSTQVRLLEPGGIERSIGKAKRVIDKRPKLCA
jgi:phenylacetate-CoA ligase